MNGRVKKLSCIAVVAASLLGSGACSRPDEDAVTRITGDKNRANPEIPETTAAPTTEATTTTRFWAPEGPGGSGQIETEANAEDEAVEDADDEIAANLNQGTSTSTTTTTAAN